MTGWPGWRALVSEGGPGGRRFWVDMPAEGEAVALQEQVGAAPRVWGLQPAGVQWVSPDTGCRCGRPCGSAAARPAVELEVHVLGCVSRAL